MNKIPRIVTVALILVLFINNVLLADFVDIKKARQIAQNKINLTTQNPGFTIRSEKTFRLQEQLGPLFYVFELIPQGYVVVSADTDLPPVIAYSYESFYEIPGSLQNPLTDLLLADLQNRTKNILNTPDEIISDRNLEWEQLLLATVSKDSGKAYGPYLETSWGQGPPYNNFCPMDPTTNQRSIAGCPAVAMAQIINYYKTINETIFTDLDDYYHSYAGINFWIDDDYEEYDFPPFPMLNAHLDTLVECWQNQTTLKENEMAALNFACGVAAKQVYTSSIAGTFGVNQAFEAYLRFGFNEAVLVLENDTSLYTQLIQNMIDGKPAHLAVVDEGWTMGHNLVVDGYNENDGLFHLNLGWNGSYNGYYLLPDEIPYGLTVIEGLILDIGYPPVYTNVPTSNNLFNSGEISISPNPAKDFINIDFFLQDAEPINISIYSIDGSLVHTCLIENLSDGLNTVRLDLNESGRLKSGIYFSSLKSKKSIFTRKFTVR